MRVEPGVRGVVGVEVARGDLLPGLAVLAEVGGQVEVVPQVPAVLHQQDELHGEDGEPDEPGDPQAALQLRCPGMGRRRLELGRLASHPRYCYRGGHRASVEGRPPPGGSLRSRPMTSPAEVQAQADALYWYHSIDLGDGVVTKGASAQDKGAEILPDVSARSVLDIGAWDGKYSFLAEQAGADRVVALDHYAWGIDFAAPRRVLGRVHRQRRLPRPVARRDGLLAARPAGAPQLRVRRRDARLQGRAGGGQLPDVRPRRARDVRRGAVSRRALPHEGAAHLPRAGARRHQGGGGHRVRGGAFPRPRARGAAAVLRGSSLRIDFGNWFVPTIEALHNLCRAAGFAEVRTVVGPPAPPSAPDPLTTTDPPPSLRERVARRVAGTPPPKHPEPQPSAPSTNYRVVVHAYA